VVVKYSYSSVDMEEEGGLDSDGRTYSSRKEMWEAEAGEDPNGNDAKSIAKKLEWYHKGVSYWESVEASVDGVLGGYGSVNARDVADSNAFILEMFNECPPGAGDLVALGETHTWPTELCSEACIYLCPCEGNFFHCVCKPCGHASTWSVFRHHFVSQTGCCLCADCGAGVGRVTKNFLLHHFHEVMITCNPTQDMPGNISHPRVIAGHGVCLPFFWLLSLPSVV
jgi:hypothetical protein